MYYSVIIAFYCTLARLNCLLLIKKKVNKNDVSISRAHHPIRIVNSKSQNYVHNNNNKAHMLQFTCTMPHYVLQFVIIFQVKKTCVVMGASFSLLKSLRIETILSVTSKTQLEFGSALLYFEISQQMSTYKWETAKIQLIPTHIWIIRNIRYLYI